MTLQSLKCYATAHAIGYSATELLEGIVCECTITKLVTNKKVK